MLTAIPSPSSPVSSGRRPGRRESPCLATHGLGNLPEQESHRVLGTSPLHVSRAHVPVCPGDPARPPPEMVPTDPDTPDAWRYLALSTTPQSLPSVTEASQYKIHVFPALGLGLHRVVPRQDAHWTVRQQPQTPEARHSHAPQASALLTPLMRN